MTTCDHDIALDSPNKDIHVQRINQKFEPSSPLPLYVKAHKIH